MLLRSSSIVDAQVAGSSLEGDVVSNARSALSVLHLWNSEISKSIVSKMCQMYYKCSRFPFVCGF